MAKIHFDITADNNEFLSKVKGTVNQLHESRNAAERAGVSFSELGKRGNEAGDAIDKAFKKIAAGTALLFSVDKVKDFIGEVVNVRKEFQSLEISFSTLLGSAEKGKKMFADITQFATTTPMLEKDLAKAAQTMLGFNIEAEKVMPLLQQIGDISMGDSQKFQSLALSFSQASSTGKLMGQDLLQMINAGFNPLVEISRTTGRSMAELKDAMSKGEISIEMLEGALKSATSEGGKFNGMLESMSHTMEGAISNFEGAVQKLMNDIGERIETPIVNATTNATNAINLLAENIDVVSTAIADMVITFGAYKAACMAVSSGLTSLTIAEAAQYSWLVLCEKAQKLLNATMLKNPYVMAAVAAGTLIAALYNIATATVGAERAQEQFNEQLKKESEELENRKKKAEDVVRIYQDEASTTTQRINALNGLSKEYKVIFQRYLDEKGHLRDIINLKKELIALEGKNAVEAHDKEAKKMQQYAAVMRQVANSANGISSLSKIQRDIYNEANKYFSDNNSWTTIAGSGAREKAAYFEKLSKENASQASKQATDNSINKFVDSIKQRNDEDLKKWVSVLTSAKTSLKGNIKGRNVKGFGVLTGLQIDTLLSEISNQQKSRKGEDRNKAYWEQQKKNAQTQLDALTDIEAKGKKGEALRKQIEDYDKKLSAYSTSKTNADSSKASKAEEQRNKALSAQQQKYNDIILKQEEELATKREQIELQTQQARIDQMKDGSAKTIAQIELDYKKQIAAIELAEGDMLRAQVEAARKRWEAKNPNAGKNGQNWENTGYHQWKEETGGAKLTKEQQDLLEEQRRAARAVLERALEDEQQLRLQALYNYMKSYGSMEEQRLAITKEYEQKIADAKDEIEKASLRKQQEEALNAINMREIKESIDWEEVFNDISRLSTKYLSELQKKLKEGLKDKSINPEDAKVLAEKIREIETTIAERGNIATQLLPGLRERLRMVEEVKDAEAEIANLQEKQKGIQKELETKKFALVGRLNDNGVDASVNDSSADFTNALNESKDVTDKEREAILILIDEIKTLETDLGKNTEAVSKAQDTSTRKKNVLDSLGGSGKFKLKDLFAGVDTKSFTDVFNLIGNNMNGLNELTKSLGIHDTEFGKAVEGFNEGTQSFMGAIQSLASGDIFGAVAGVINGFSSWGNTIGNIFGLGKDDNGYADMMAQYENMSKYWDELLEKKKAYINESYGPEATKSKDEAIKIIEDQIEAQRKLVDAYKGGGASAGSHSYGYRFNRDWTDNKDVQRALKEAGISTNGVGLDYALNTATPEQLKKFKESVGSAWAMMDSDFTSHWDKIIDSIEASEEVINSWKERLTGMSFDGMKDNFISQLMDMDSSVEDFADNMTKSLTQAMLNAQIDKVLGNDLEAYYDEWAKAMENGSLSDEELKKLQKMYDDIIQKGIETRDNVAKVTGYDGSSSSQQEATANGIKSITADQADQLVGRITAIQIAVEASKTANITNGASLIAGINSLVNAVNSITMNNGILDDIRTAHATANSHLENIVKQTKDIYRDFLERLDSIKTNTAQL